MAYKTDYSPVDYLRRRIIYYKKQSGVIRNLIKKKILIERYGGKQNLKNFITIRIKAIENRMIEYEAAIKKLSKNK